MLIGLIIVFTIQYNVNFICIAHLKQLLLTKVHSSIITFSQTDNNLTLNPDHSNQF